MSIYKGDTLIALGTIDSSLNANSTNPIQNKAVTNAINNIGKKTIPAGNFIETTSTFDTNGEHVYSEYVKKDTDIMSNTKIFRIFGYSGNVAKNWLDLYTVVTDSTAEFNIKSDVLTPSFKINSNNVYHEGYMPYKVGTFTATETKTVAVFNADIGFNPSFVIYSDNGTLKTASVTTTGFYTTVTEGTYQYIAFR